MSVTDMRHRPKPTVATPTPEPLAPEEPAPEEPAPKVTTLPDPTPPEPQQPEAEAGGEEQVEATDAAPEDGTSKCLIAHG
jgi:hypothetical protein